MQNSSMSNSLKDDYEYLYIKLHVLMSKLIVKVLVRWYR